MFCELRVASCDHLLFPFIIVYCILFALSSKISTSNKIIVFLFVCFLHTHTKKQPYIVTTQIVKRDFKTA